MAIRGRLSRRSGGAILHFSHPPIPDVIRFRDDDFRAKREFHVTLIGSTTMRTLTSASDLDADDVIRRAGKKLAFTITLRDELWHLRENETRTLIRLCGVNGGDEFFARIENELQTAIERPPYHVTLYTIGTLRGIGIATPAELEQFGEKIEGAERDALLSVLQ
ncbi:MAG: hypothetical protein QOK37_1330 [Thermoanaerobaculia bacterium]|jgi:hypothetical protein|nr:hypothetical protein [Thermoanaerobaculia bacterium]